MLTDKPVMISFAVDDLAKAKKFYAEQLGVEVDESVPSMLGLKLPGNNVMIYAKDNYKPAVYTVLNFTVDDLEKTMKELEAKGVTFEQYDEPGCKTDKDGVVDYGMMKAAFFNDPAGNNHGIYQITHK